MGQWKHPKLIKGYKEDEIREGFGNFFIDNVPEFMITVEKFFWLWL